MTTILPDNETQHTPTRIWRIRLYGTINEMLYFDNKVECDSYIETYDKKVANGEADWGIAISTINLPNNVNEFASFCRHTEDNLVTTTDKLLNEVVEHGSEHIVKCVNMHDELVEALEKVNNQLKTYIHKDHWRQDDLNTVQEINAVLAKAKEGSHA